MSARLFSSDPITKTHELFRYDAATDTFTIETVQDVEDLVEQNKASFNAQEKHTRWGEGQIVGRIPMWLYFKLVRENVIDPEGNVHDDKALLKWLDDSQNQAWRTRPGSLSR